MSSYRRNVLVGITVLTALVILGWMIFKFGGKIVTPFAGEMMHVTFVTERADGVSDGSAVTYRGVSVGRVVKIMRDENQKEIRFEAEVEIDPPLPGNVDALIRQASLLGSGSRIELEPKGDPTSVHLKDGQVISARFVGLDFFPPEVSNLSKELAATAKQFREANVIVNFNKRLDDIGGVLAEARKTLEAVNKVVDDEKFRNSVTVTIDNVRSASESVKSVAERADKLAVSMQGTVDQVNKTVEEIAKVSANANQITSKINDGKGTAGQLINDPKLYDGLVETTNQLNASLKDLHRLIQQWEQEGVSLKIQ